MKIKTCKYFGGLLTHAYVNDKPLCSKTKKPTVTAISEGVIASVDCSRCNARIARGEHLDEMIYTAWDEFREVPRFVFTLESFIQRYREELENMPCKPL